MKKHDTNEEEEFQKAAADRLKQTQVEQQLDQAREEIEKPDEETIIVKKKRGKFFIFLNGLLDLAPKIIDVIKLFKKK